METQSYNASSMRIVKWTLAIILLIVLFFGRITQGATIDIMLVYDTTAATWVETNGGMNAFSHDAVNRMNLAMENSEVDISFRLAHSASVAYTHEGNLEDDLYALTDAEDAFSNVHSLRDEYGADLVALLVDTGSPYGWVGLGWTLWTDAGTPDYAFTCNAIQSVDLSDTLTHEVGHNLGAHHSKEQASSPGPNTYLGDEYSYSAGWYFTGANNVDYCTIMAYNDKDNNGIADHNSVTLFSTPLVTYEGTPAGDALDGDNACLLRDTMEVVAAYKRTVAVGSLEVTIQPPEVRTAGAQWRRTGTETWLDSGVIENNLPTGDHIIEFKTVRGWVQPGNMNTTIFANQTETASETYTLKKRQAMPWIQLLLLD